MEAQLMTLISTERQYYFSTFSEEKLLCKGDLKAISFLTPISKKQHQELERKYLCQMHYNHEIKSKDVLINLPARFYRILKLDSTTKICHRCIRFTDNDPDYTTNKDYIQTKQVSQKQNINKPIWNVKPFQNLSKSMKYKQYKKTAASFSEIFYNEVQSISYSSDQIVLNKIIFSVNNQQFCITYNDNQQNKNLKKLAIVCAMDEQHISRDAYRAITKIKQDLSKEW
ncbi:21893_t:CDS:2, partial [Dentiscutata erythropus]